MRSHHALGGVSINVVPTPVVRKCNEPRKLHRPTLRFEKVHGGVDSGDSGVARQEQVPPVDDQTHDHSTMVASATVAAFIIKEHFRWNTV
jgi:hypothetical protein